MADRLRFDHSRSGDGATVGRGKFVARLKTDSVSRSFAGSSAGGAAPADRVPVPEVRVSKGGKVTVTGGMRGAVLARDLGLSSTPVAMSKQSWRNAAAAGIISRDGGGRFANEGKRTYSRAGDLVVTVDTTDMWRVGQQLQGVGLDIRKGHVSISRAINWGIRRLKTTLKRDVRQWTGLRQVATIEQAFRITPSTPGTMTGVLRVVDRHHMIGRKNFDAKWRRQDPGATHRAWNRPQLAAGAFMIAGKEPIFRREGKARFPVAPLWGPNIAREVTRHRPVVEARLAVINADVAREASRLIRVAIARKR